jgi:S-formylglutathione hydrolase
MRFSVYLPPQALGAAGHAQRVPALYYLAGLTCTEEQLPVKAAAQRVAAELGLALVSCDTSPRSTRYDEDDNGGVGLGAGFYLDAELAPWSASYRMETHVVEELPRWVEQRFPIRTDVRGIFGHSMGGHGALTLALRHPGRYQSLSAFAPITAPSQVPWGQAAFNRYLGASRAGWASHDACELLTHTRFPGVILVDQGLADPFLARELHPERFETVCSQVGQSLVLRRHAGYDHGYYFIQTFVADHLHHHAACLR